MEHLPLLTSSAASRKKVFGLGPPRTGTDSLRVALTHLGFGPTYHMREVLFEDAGIPTGDDMEKWRQAGLGNDIHKNLAEILEPWRSGCDLPLMAFPDELLELHPDAKFILTVRPAEEWLASMSKTICQMSGGLSWYMQSEVKSLYFHLTDSRHNSICRVLLQHICILAMILWTCVIPLIVTPL